MRFCIMLQAAAVSLRTSGVWRVAYSRSSSAEGRGALAGRVWLGATTAEGLLCRRKRSWRPPGVSCSERGTVSVLHLLCQASERVSQHADPT